MTLSNLIALVDDTRPNQYDRTIKTQWVNEIEGKAIDEVFNRAEGDETVFTPYNYDEDSEKVLAIPDRFSDVYVNYLYAKIDYTQNEIDRYNNDVASFEASYLDFSSWHLRHNMPKAVI